MYTSKEFEDEVIEEALDKAFERLGYNQYSFSEELKDTYEYEMTDYDNTDGFFDDLACSGCQGMVLGGFIYHDELEDFYIRHHDDIESFKSYLEQDIGSPLYDGSGHYADFACWLVIEEVAYNVREELPDCLEEAVKEVISSQSIDDQDAFIEALSKEDIKCFVIDSISEDESLSAVDDGLNLVDLENGVTENRFSNGQLSFVRNYDLRGNVEGLFERFNDRGQLIYSGLYESGRPIGIHKEWYDSGALLAESRYGSNGVLKEEKLYSETGHLTSDKVELMGCYLNEMFGEDGSLIKRSVDDVSGNPLYKNQIKGDRLSNEQKMALEYYQPVRVKEGWLQLGMDGRARCFSADPAFIIDEVHVLAKKLEPALRKQFECDGVDPDKYIHIKVDVPINGQRTTLGNIQSLIQEKESKTKSNGMKM